MIAVELATNCFSFSQCNSVHGVQGAADTQIVYVYTYVHIHAKVMKHNYKPIGSLGVHVYSDLQWLYLCSIWGPMSHSHQMYIHMQHCVYV